ncbi:MAG: DUF4340 domain-containing protein [Geminocystis sp.]|nr:DUF4340 domain-containing protein [Geminocystis sp.]HIK36755.1 DUF4340 domain-containing protein [Geminocystis sp. M7585_C2015_104]MCS7148511.1 DUF4340 domain-containing protein [Geminocystis sp.]MCX8079467.1 DUF4340 domain-containing protein [Geminocystis sp.]MDW8114916.1 DUF4340 domain-containing protein [Geminocystis sp.]
MRLKTSTICLAITAVFLAFITFSPKLASFFLSAFPDLFPKSLTKSQPIFPFSPGEIKRIKLRLADNKRLEFVRISNQPPQWQMIYPQNTKANDAAVSFLTSLFPNAKREIELIPTPQQRQEYGITSSSPTIHVFLQNGQQYRISLGKSNFDDTQIYAEVVFPDSSSQPSRIFLLSKSFQYALQRDFSEWKQPQ